MPTTTTTTMEKDVVKAIDTAAPTINEGNKDVIVTVDIVVEEEVETETKIDFRFRYISIQVQQQQQTPKRVFVLPKRKKTGPLRWHQHHGRNGSGLPATTKKKNRNNNNNNDDGCSTTDSTDLQGVCSKQIRQFRLRYPFRL